jgi:uncharacterized protein YcbK (DUF882 family)
VADHALLPREREAGWSGGGLTRRQELAFDGVAFLFIGLFLTGWVLAVLETFEQRRLARQEERAAMEKHLPSPPLPPPTVVSSAVSSSLLDPRATSMAFLNDAAMKSFDPLRGESGKLHLVVRTEGSQVTKPTGNGEAALQFHGPKGEEVVSPDFTAPDQPGLYSLAVKVDQASRVISGITVATLVPFAEKQSGRIGLYYLGRWPFESGGKPKTPAYANPVGFIEVTRENKDTFVSDHFKLEDFLTKGQETVWPKYMLLNPKLLDKLELIIADLQSHGHPVRHIQVMSGFRTPNYNYTGGNTGGRANLSRHMYGDASDIFIDNDRNGVMDDLNGDGRVDVRDAEVILQSAERVEQKYPVLVGGVGAYTACCGHGPFTHVDVRGYRARWRGTGNG